MKILYTKTRRHYAWHADRTFCGMDYKGQWTDFPDNASWRSSPFCRNCVKSVEKYNAEQQAIYESEVARTPLARS